MSARLRATLFGLTSAGAINVMGGKTNKKLRRTIISGRF
jgi:hypothetical protein